MPAKEEKREEVIPQATESSFQKKRKSSSTSTSPSSKDSSESTSSFDSEDYPPEHLASKSMKGSYNPYRNRWTGKIQKNSGSADGSIDTCLKLMEETLGVREGQDLNHQRYFDGRSP